MIAVDNPEKYVGFVGEHLYLPRPKKLEDVRSVVAV